MSQVTGDSRESSEGRMREGARTSEEAIRTTTEEETRTDRVNLATTRENPDLLLPTRRTTNRTSIGREAMRRGTSMKEAREDLFRRRALTREEALRTTDLLSNNRPPTTRTTMDLTEGATTTTEGVLGDTTPTIMREEGASMEAEGAPEEPISTREGTRSEPKLRTGRL